MTARKDMTPEQQEEYDRDVRELDYGEDSRPVYNRSHDEPTLSDQQRQE